MGDLFDLEFLAGFLPELLRGLGRTILVSALGIVIGLLIGIAGGMLRYFRVRFVDGLLSAYVEIVRNTPNLIVVLFLYFGLPGIGLQLSSFTAGYVALGLIGGAYCIEAFRAGFLAVPQAYARAGTALAMTRIDVFAYIIFPNGLRIAFPSISNSCVGTIKTSTLLIAIGYPELMATVMSEVSLTFQVLELFTAMALTYLVVIWAFSMLMRAIEHRLMLPER